MASILNRSASWMVHPWAVGLFGLIMSAIFTLQHGQHAEQFLSWRPFLDFVGEHPFQARVLPFVMARVVSAFHRLGSVGLFNFFQAVDFIATCLAFWFVWKTARKLLQDKALAILAAIALFWWQLWATFVISPIHNYYYPYDMMSLAFISCALWGIVSEWSLRRMLALTFVAMFNRETFVVVPFFYLAFHWPASKANWREVGLLVLTCVLIKLGISQAFRAYGEMATFDHMGLLRFSYNFSFLTLEPEMVHTANAFLLLGATWLLLPWGTTSDPHLRRMMWCFVPYFLGMMIVGNLSEIRIFAEFIPLMSLLLASKLARPSRASDQADLPPVARA